MKIVIKWILNLLFPRRCAVCDGIIPGDKCICDTCKGKVRLLTEPTCRKCGKKIQKEDKLYCYDCGKKPHVYNRGFGVFEYQDMKDSLYRFKYAGRAEYARYYAEVAMEQRGALLKELKADALVPVPLHPKRFRKRGYNQAREFAQELSGHMKIPVNNMLVKRRINTIPLKMLRGSERQNNLKKAFLITGNVVKLKTIIIIDDIYTTGATIDAIAAVCKSAGIEQIYFLTVAIGKGL